MEKEMELRSDYLGNERVDTIYLGGGTPSILSARSLDRLFSKLHALFSIAPSAEITLEANPDDLTDEKLSHFRQLGINRLSIGIQTFDDALLHYLNRVHSREQAITRYERARVYGFSNISVDLMYAIPGQTLTGWATDLDQTLALNPEHISAYCLTIEERTAFGHWTKSGKMQPVPDEQAAEYLHVLMDTLPGHGYEQYEISNFARPGYLSQHNSNYWKNVNYLGIGPGAHSYNGSSRQANLANNYRYVKAIFSGEVPAQVEQLTQEERVNEYILTSLRTAWGLDTRYLKQAFNIDIIKKYPELLTQLTNNGFLEITDGVIKLTSSGKLFADKISADLFEP